MAARLRRLAGRAAGACLAAAAGPVFSQAFTQAPLITPWAAGAAAPPAPWHFAGLPNQKKPATRFNLVELDGKAALRIEADAAYGNLVHPLNPAQAPTALSWSWRVDHFVEGADLRTRAGDDNAVKVCVSFDMALEHVPFIERQTLRLARALTPEPLPTATVCYVWDEHLAAGSALPNAYTHRMRYLVAHSGNEHAAAWTPEHRDLQADFLQLFGDETQQVPPVTAVAVGADADNTHGHSLAHVADLVLEP